MVKDKLNRTAGLMFKGLPDLFGQYLEQKLSKKAKTIEMLVRLSSNKGWDSAQEIVISL